MLKIKSYHHQNPSRKRSVKRIPSEVRNRQISSNNTEIIFQENEGSEGEIRAFSGFVLASDAIEYPKKRLAFDIA